ncbi:hypothetical protein SCUCBS95973_008797 [Sporothrix curviconia]|uniref:Tat pathway signal sequence domain protein n=1 Tax=Sporothrix curviconia TaxID=1260050 RepID=A0ABP0CPW6_9PEZI
MSPDGFTARKRTGHGHAWVNVPGGQRAAGTVYLGTAQHGGLAIGMRYFWERYPTSLAIENAAGDTGTIALWLYSPEAGPMDLRPYHDGLGQQTYSDQLDALSTTYEDWEPGLGSPRGIARTNEIMLYGLSATPTSTEFSYMSQRVQDPPVLVSQRRWYGFWDHGDIMHTYDSDRHTWRYDVGGYAWDNSELSPDLWLWLYFLCTGHKDVFRLAEAMTRHTGKVDVYHLPPWRGLGTRHGVQHWSDSCKQARIANAIYRRIFYYLSGGDDRVGELLRETLDAPLSFTALDPYRKVRKPPAHGEAPLVRNGCGVVC